MKCEEVLQFIDQYADMSEEDATRIELEAHFCDCEHCASLFDQNLLSFEQAAEWTNIAPFNHEVTANVTDKVMDRIYQDESWYMPITRKTYTFSKSFKRNIAIVMASCLAMFSIALFTIIYQDHSDKTSNSTAATSGVLDITVASSSGSTTSELFSTYVPVASLSDPIVMRAVPTYSQYYIALSLFGIILTLLLLNWFTRTKQ